MLAAPASHTPVLRALRTCGPLTRSELVSKTGLSHNTLHKAVDCLLQKDVLTEKPALRPPGTPGRR